MFLPLWFALEAVFPPPNEGLSGYHPCRSAVWVTGGWVNPIPR